MLGNNGAGTVKILVIDVGGTHLKILRSGETESRRVRSGRKMTAADMVARVNTLAEGWSWDAVSIGYPGPVRDGVPVGEPPNLATGWVGFDFAAAFGKPLKLVNDATMQALGSHTQGKMLFLGLGTGLGTALVVEGIPVPMELGHLPYRDGTFEDYVGAHALKRDGRHKWRKRVIDVVTRLQAALLPDEIVLGGGNSRLLKALPPHCRIGDNANAFTGGFRLWEGSDQPRQRAARKAAAPLNR